MKKIVLLICVLTYSIITFSQSDLTATKLTINKNTDGGELLNFNTDRPWAFYNIGTGASSTLRLSSLINEKTFEISNLDGTSKTALFHVNNDLASSRVYLVPNGGKVGIGGTTAKAYLDVSSDISNGKLGTIFGRLPEGNTSGDGTFLGVRGYETQNVNYNLKSFAIEHSFYGQVNSAINFYRGGSTTGGFITFNVNNNNEVLRINYNGYVGIGTDSPDKELEVIGTVLSNRVETNILNTGDLGTHSFQELGETKAFIQWRGTTTSTYPSKFRIGTQSSDDMWFVTNGASRMIINSDGNVGIGTTDPKAKLSVNGTIISSEIKVLADISQYPDFVFSDHYELRSIKEVEKYIEDNNHLPDIPKADEVKEGIALGEMNAKLLQKIEELTLYMIDLNSKVEKLEKENELLKSKFDITQ